MEQIFNFLISCWTLSNLIGFIGGAIIGFSISIGLPRKSCKHNWIIIEDGYLHRYENNIEQEKVGFMKVYECTHCKKMKSEKVMI
jgi:hypothetical protein